jgi:hypothetical protein
MIDRETREQKVDRIFKAMCRAAIDRKECGICAHAKWNDKMNFGYCDATTDDYCDGEFFEALPEKEW